MENAVMQKIKKLLSLATSENQAEAESAHKKAMQLMVKHNIKTIEEDKEISHDLRFANVESQEIKFVHQILLDCFFVAIIKSRVFSEKEKRIQTKYRIIGDHTNKEIALYAHDYLIIEFKRKWDIYRKKNNIRKRYKQTFYAGLAQGFRQAFDDAKNYSPDKMELVIAKNKDAIDEYIKQEVGKTKTVKPKYAIRDKNIYGDGKAEGKDIKIAKAIHDKNKDKTKLIGG